MKHLVLLLWGTAAFAQFGGVSSTADGSSVYFTTSLRLRGSELPAIKRAYVYDGHEFRLQFASDGYGITGVDVSDDARVQIFHAEPACDDPACQWFSREVSFLKIGEDTFLYPGALQMSRNGRYLLHRAYDELNSLWRSRWIDLEQGIIRDLPDGASFQNRFALTNEGQALILLSGGLVLWQDGQTKSIDSCFPAWVTPTGANIISLCSRMVPIPNRTPILPLFTTVYDAYVLDVARQFKTKYKENVSSTGPLAIAEHYWMIGDELISLPALTAQNVRGSITAAWISSDERYLLAVNGNSLTRRDLITQAQDDLVPTVPVLSLALGAPFGVPGSVIRLPVSGLSASAKVSLSGQLLKTTVDSLGQAFAQVPWDLPAGTHALRVELNPDFPFEVAPLEFPLYAWQPMPVSPMEWTNYFTLSPRVDHFPFQAPRAGDLADFYLSGLGPVNNPPAYGEPTPNDFPRTVLRPVQATLREQLRQNQIPLEVIYARLAPGLIGTYVVEVRLPRAQDLATFTTAAPVPVLIEFGPAGEKGPTGVALNLFLR